MKSLLYANRFSKIKDNCPAFFCRNKEILILLLLAFTFNLAIASLVDVVNPDCVRYANSAYQLFNGDLSAAFVHEKMLFYSLTLGLSHFLFNDWAFAGQFISVLFLALTILPLYFITRELFNARAAFWAAVVFILLPLTSELAGEVVKDAPFLFFLMSALMFGCQAIRARRLVYYLATFLCVFFSALYRFEAIVFWFYFNLFILLTIVKESKERAHYVKGLFLYNSILILLIFVTYIAFVTGLLPTSLLSDVWSRFESHYFNKDLFKSYHAIYDHLKSVEKMFIGGIDTNDFFEIARYNIALIYLFGVVQVLVGALSYVYIFPLIVGIKYSDKSSLIAKILFGSLLFYFMMIYFFLTTRNFVAERYTLSLVTMFLPFVGFGVEWFNSIATQRYRRLAISLSLIVFIIFPFYKSYASTLVQKTEIRMAGEWLHKNRDVERQRIITNEERIPFYAGLMRGGYEVHPYEQSMNYADIALARQCSLMVLELSLREEGILSDFENFQLVGEFRGDRKVVLIYETNL